MAGTLAYAVVYAFGYFLVGLFEEFAFRGYLQSTMASGIGFWPAAVILSAGFGAAHLQNGVQSVLPATIAFCFGLLATLTLRRTGGLWFAICLHAAFDWSAAFLAAAPLSGYVLEGRPWQGVLYGPDRITGGAAGPRGSALMFVVLAAATWGVRRWLRGAGSARSVSGECFGQD